MQFLEFEDKNLRQITLSTASLHGLLIGHARFSQQNMSVTVTFIKLFLQLYKLCLASGWMNLISFSTKLKEWTREEVVERAKLIFIFKQRVQVELTELVFIRILHYPWNTSQHSTDFDILDSSWSVVFLKERNIHLNYYVVSERILSTFFWFNE